mgnify:CR=1 FL=1
MCRFGPQSTTKGNKIMDKFKKLDQLIEQVLAERSYSMDDMYSTGRNLPSPTTTYEMLSQLTDPQRELTDGDFEYLNNNLEAFTTDIQKRLVAIQKSSDASPELKAKVQSVFDVLQKASDEKLRQRQTITQPQIRSAGGEVGDFPDELNTIIPEALGDGGFLSKMKVATDISTTYFDAVNGDKEAIKHIENLDNREFLAEVMLLEYFAEIANSFDAGSGAYLFEYFLAMIAGGKVTGKDTTAAGKMGAVDFETKSGGAGSAKYYSNAANIGQATGGFTVGVPVDYVIAIKKQGSEQVGKKGRGTSDPARMMGADIYYLRVTRVEEDRYNSKFKIAGLRSDGSISRQPQTTWVSNKLHLSDYIDSSSLLGTIYIAETRTQTFRDMIYKSISSDGNKIKQKIIQLVEDFFKSLDEAGSSAKEYAVSGDVDKGSNTLSALNKADYSFNNLKGSLESTENVGDEEIQENKFTALDKLIEAVILEEQKKGNQ